MRVHWSNDGSRFPACGQKPGPKTRHNPFPTMPFATRIPAEVTCRRDQCRRAATEYANANGLPKPGGSDE